MPPSPPPPPGRPRHPRRERPWEYAALVLLLLLAACRPWDSAKPAKPGRSADSVDAVDGAAPRASGERAQPAAADSDIPEPPSPPPFLVGHAVAPAALARISLFRSAVGHDFSDGVEDCRSMKHYLQLLGSGSGDDAFPAWTQIPVHAPFEGRVETLVPEERGQQVWLRPQAAPDYRVGIFHLAPLPALAAGDPVWPGLLLGHPAGHDTYLDLVLEWSPPGGGRRLLSYFQALDPGLWEDFRAQGIASPADLLIERSVRDASPLRCRGESFEASGPSETAIAHTPAADDAARPADLTDWARLAPPPAIDAAAVAGALSPQLRLSVLAEGLPYPVALAWGPAPAGSGREGQPVLWVATNGEAFPAQGSTAGAIWWLDALRPETPPAETTSASLAASGASMPDQDPPAAMPAQARPFLQGLDRPLGLAWTGTGPGAELLVSSRGRLAAWRDADGDGRAEAQRLIVTGLPADGLHQNNSLALGPGGRIYLGLGTAGNADEAVEDPLAGSILRLEASGSPAPQVHAWGLRNPFDLAFGPDGRLWATDNGVDPPVRQDAPDELNLIVEGGFYGHPEAFGDEAAGAVAGDPGRPALPPAALFPAHASADGLLAYRGRRFGKLRGLLLAAEFGSYLYSAQQSGRRLVLLAPPPPGRPDLPVSVAALVDPFPGRPLDLVEGPDGRIQVADFEGGKVWTITP